MRPLVEFESELKPISLLYPSSWLVYNLPEGNHGDKEIIAWIGPRGYNYPSIYIMQRTVGLLAASDLSNIAAWGESRILEDRDYQEVSLEDVKIAGQRSLVRKYTIRARSLPFLPQEVLIHCADVYLFHFEEGYIISMCVDERRLEEITPMFNEIMNSISFSNS